MDKTEQTRTGRGRSGGWSSGGAGRSRKGEKADGGQAVPEDDRPVISATVVAFEMHPKLPRMYKVALRCVYDVEEADAASLAGVGAIPAEDTPENWRGEVDAFIAGVPAAGGDQEVWLQVHEDTFVGWRLLKGRELSAEEYARLKEEERREEAYRVALRLLEFKARTSSELSKALKRKGYAAEAVEGCLERLRARGMLDDSAYAQRFTEQRATGQRKGRLLIRQELLQRGIARQDADEAISAIDGTAEQEAALALARKRWPSVKGEPRERLNKLMGILMRRGYPSSVVRETAKRVASEAAVESEEWLDDAD